MTGQHSDKNQYMPGETEAWHKDFVDPTCDLIQCVDSEGRFIYVNQAWLSTLRYSADDIDNIALWDIIHLDSMEHCMAVFKEILTDKAVGEVEAVFVTKDGTPVMVEGNVSVKLDENNRFMHTRGIFRDVTARKKAEEALQQERAFQAILLDLAAGFINVPLAGFDRAINDMLGKIGEFTNLDRVYLFKHDHQRRLTSNTHEWCKAGITSEKDHSQNIPFDFFTDWLTAWDKGEIVHIPSVAQVPQEHAMRTIFLQQGIQSLILIPLMQDKVNIGFVGFDAVNECKSFSEREIALLRVLAEIISNAFARKVAEEQVRKSEERFNQLAEHSRTITWEVNADGLYTYVSHVATAVLGYRPEELAGRMHFYELHPEERREAFKSAAFEMFARREPFENLVNTVLSKTGETHWMSTNGIPLLNPDGTLRGYRGTDTDITERKAAEEALKASEQKYREILSAMEEGYYEVDLAGNFVFFNESFCRMFGCSSEGLMGESYKQFYKNLEIVFKTYNQVFKTGRPVTAADWPVITRDGREIYLELSISLCRDEKGEPIGFRGVARDITERRQADEKIRYLSFHDQLTGLYNRHFLEEEMKRLDTERQLPISIIMADLNGLKLVNDTYGHQTGDEMLKRAAAILSSVCRVDDLLARFGGDEFVLYLPRAPVNDARKISERIEKAYRSELINDVPLSLSTGLAVKTSAEQKLSDLLREAEDNMYRDKLTESRSGKSAIVNSLLQTLAAKSFETEAHTHNMQEAANSIGKKLSLPHPERHRLSLLITLHDIGKINIPEELLIKKGPLSDAEWEIMKKHCETGYRVAKATESFAHVADDILAHHERWDGSGYPQGLKGDKIPLLARIAAIADAYEVMGHGRPYKKAMSRGEIVAEFKKCSGTQFDPELVELFLAIMEAGG